MRHAMALVHASVTVFSPDDQRSEEVRVLVDTGSTLTWLPEDLLTRMGLRPSGIAGFRTADDQTVERPIADVAIGCEGVRGVVRIAFARPGDANVLELTGSRHSDSRLIRSLARCARSIVS